MHVLVDQLLLNCEHLNLAFFRAAFFPLLRHYQLRLVGFGLGRRLLEDLVGTNPLGGRYFELGGGGCGRGEVAAQIEVEDWVGRGLREALCVRKFIKFISTFLD